MTMNLEQEFGDVFSFYTDHVFPLYNKYWKAYLKDETDRQPLLEKWQSSVYVSMTQKNIDVMYASLYDAQMGYGVTGINEAGVKNAKNVRAYLDWCFELCNGRSVVLEAAFDAFVTGKGYFRTEWQEREETVERATAKGTVKFSLSDTSAPAIRSVSPYSILLDPTASSLEASRYLYELRWLSLDQALNAYTPFFPDTPRAELKAELKARLDVAKPKPQTQNQERIETGSAENGDFLKHRVMMAKSAQAKYEEVVREAQPNQMRQMGTSDFSLNYNQDTYLFAERWDNDGTLKVFVNGKKAFADIKHAVPIAMKPYAEIYHKKLPRSVLGLGVAGGLSDLQYMSNLIWNLKLDSAKFYAIPVYTRKQGLGSQLYGGGPKLSIHPGMVIPVAENDELQPLMKSGHGGNIEILRQELIDLNSEANQSSGVNEYVMGTQGKVERSAVAVKTLVSSFKTRLSPFISSINHASARIAKQWMAYTFAMGDDTLFFPLLGPDGTAAVQEVTLNDIAGQYTFSFEVDGLSAITQEADKETLIKLLPVLEKFMYNPVTKEEIVDVREIVENLCKKFELPFKMKPPASAEQQAAIPGVGGEQDLMAQMQQLLSPPTDAALPEEAEQQSGPPLPAMPLPGAPAPVGDAGGQLFGPGAA